MNKYGLITVRIRKHIRELFKKEPHPSNLVNELLERHYKDKK